MANNYFQFKQFTIQQDRCAMKVCTDACLFGAWLANELNNFQSTPSRLLDIGTGTGLLSLMLAQQSNARIESIELDPAAFTQACENVSASPWKDQILVKQGRVQELVPDQPYDLIFSNPPFYEKDLKSPDAMVNAARHDSTLTLDELISYMSDHLTENGKSAVLLPFSRTDYYEEIAKRYGLYTNVKLYLKHTATHNPFRTILLSGKKMMDVSVSEICIKDEQQNYTTAFTTLMKDYYLNC